MAILVLQHSAHCHPGRLGACLRDHGFSMDIRRADQHPVGSRGGVPLDLDNVHGVVILGGPQNVTDLAKYDWMQQEVELIRQAHARELPVIGICLGCQLIGHALGGTVGPREKPAVGFYPVSVTIPGQTDVLMGGMAWNHPQYFSCGQEVSTLPAGSTLLATSKYAKHAAFKVGLRTFAAQFHFECDRAQVEAINTHSKDDMAAAGVTEGELTVQLDQHYATFGRLSDRLCVNLVTLCFPVTKKLSA